MMYDDYDDDRCVPYSRPVKRDVLSELYTALDEDVTKYANLQIDAEERGDTEQAAEHKKKFRDARTCLSLVEGRWAALSQYKRGQRYVGEPYDDGELDSWLQPTVESYYWETHKKVKKHGVEAASAVTAEEKRRCLAERRGQFLLRAYIKAHFAYELDWERRRSAPRDEDADLMPDRHEYA
jgi:hypothetical protein